MLVRDLQQVLGNFTDKFNKGMGKVEGKGNAIMYAKVYVDLGNGRLSEISEDYALWRYAPGHNARFSENRA